MASWPSFLSPLCAQMKTVTSKSHRVATYPLLLPSYCSPTAVRDCFAVVIVTKPLLIDWLHWTGLQALFFSPVRRYATLFSHVA